MEATSTKKLIMPSGSVQDLRYLYAVIDVFRQRSRQTENSVKMVGYSRKAINDYNYAKATRYGLSFAPREVNIDVAKNVISELKYLGLAQSQNGHLALTEDGEEAALLIKVRDSDKLKILFARLMLEKYCVFENFLNLVKELSNGNGVPVPSINSAVFNKFNGDPIGISKAYMNILHIACPTLSFNERKLLSLLQETNITSLDKRTEKVSRLQSAIEKYVIEEAFAPSVKSRRVYDFVRSRTSFLEFTNYAVFDFEGVPAEVTYLISDRNPVFLNSVRKVEYSSGCLYINYPSYEEARDPFKSSITKAYGASKDDFGYAKIADVRDRVCRELRLSDNLFDTYIRRLYKEEPHWLSFTYSGAGDIITEKRLPIIFEKPVRELFTLLKVN